jgi:hypothetical protein
MTFRGSLPYISIVVCFGFIYWLTMMIPNNVLYLGFKCHLPEVDQKMVYQEGIFIYGLSIVLILVNLAEILSKRADEGWLRIVKSLLTVIFSYATGAVVFLLMNTQEWNMYLYFKEIPAGMYCCITLIITIGFLLILQLLRPFLLTKLDTSFVEDYIPSWLRFDR